MGLPGARQSHAWPLRAWRLRCGWRSLSSSLLKSLRLSGQPVQPEKVKALLAQKSAWKSSELAQVLHTLKRRRRADLVVEVIRTLEPSTKLELPHYSLGISACTSVRPQRAVQGGVSVSARRV
eukprot:s4354_g3.t1